MSASEPELDALIDDAVEVLVERELTLIATPANVHAWRTRTRTALHATHDARAYELLTADLEHSGTLTVDARMLANLLVPLTGPPAVPPPREPSSNVYELAEHRRRERTVDAPADWLPEPVRDRCLAEAREALAAAKAAHATARAAEKAKANPADGGTA